jgi:UTP--glucose-1-phosphate uridylyltransferase
MQRIKKAVFPVAGLGTRFLPATKATPKEMLPIVDKPLIQYAVEEAAAAGIEEMIFVTSNTKRAIEDHFDSNYELEAKLQEQSNNELLKIVQSVLPHKTFCVYVRQPEALGLGHAVLCAKDIVGDEPFAVFLADDLIDADPHIPVMQQMVDIFSKTGTSILAVQDVPYADSRKYGMVDLKDSQDLPAHKYAAIQNVVEKPAPDAAPSSFGVVGRYILTPYIFTLLENTQPGSGGEIQLTDAIARLIGHEDVYAYEFSGKRYDCGKKIGYLEATLDFAIKHCEVGAEFKKLLCTYQKQS